MGISRRLGLLSLLMLLYTGDILAQTWQVGLTIRTVHRTKISRSTGEKYNNWNPGITIGYRTKDNIAIETGFVHNSYKKLTWVTAFGYRHGDFEVQIGGATGYKSVGQPWIRPGYFVNYYSPQNIKIKLNHEIINAGLYYER